jgi:hypothetical protein
VGDFFLNIWWVKPKSATSQLGTNVEIVLEVRAEKQAGFEESMI